MRIVVGSYSVNGNGEVEDRTVPVEFDGVLLAYLDRRTEIGTAGERLYRTAGGRLVVWARVSTDERSTYTLHQVSKADLLPGGRFAEVGVKADLEIKALPLEAALNETEEIMTRALSTVTQGQSPGAAALAMIERNATLADSTKRQYSKALSNYLNTGSSLTDAGALADYALELPASSRAFLKSAIRLWAEALGNEVKGQATPGNVNEIQAALYRLEALQEAIATKKEAGQKTHTWLSKAEVKRLLDTCENDIVGQRDRLLLGLLVAAGLRRAEAAKLRFEDVKYQPVGDRFRCVLAVKGKGAKNRTVPISDALANAIDQWAAMVGGEGHILRSLGVGRELGESMSKVAVFNAVRKRGKMIGKDDLAPHDLRRTFAQIGYDDGVPVAQIRILLGHADLKTTMTYLNVELNLQATISDFIPF